MGQELALSLAVAPGIPHTLAVIPGNYSVFPNSSGETVVYDDGIQRPATVSVPGTLVSDLQWGANASVLYAGDNESTIADLKVFSVNSNGLSLTSDYNGLVATPGKIHFDKNTSYIYDDGGYQYGARVVDPATGNLMGIFNLTPLVGFRPCVPDPQDNVVFFLGQTAQQNAAGSGLTIAASDPNTHKLLATLPLPGVTGFPINFIRWGNAGLAFTTYAGSSSTPPYAGSVYLVDGSFVTAAQPADSNSGTALTVFPSLTSINPQSAVAGASDLTLTVTGNYSGPETTVVWNQTALQTTWISATQLQATVPAADLISAGNAFVYISPSSSNSSANLSGSTALTFTILPANLGSTTIIPLNLAGGTLAWDASSAQLVLSVLSGDTQYPNSIVEVDPATGNITRVAPVMSDPYVIAVTDDDAYVYTGYLAANWVTQLTLPNLGSPVSFPLPLQGQYGPYWAFDLQPAPGEPQTVAVNFGTPQITIPDEGGITIYDSGTARPSNNFSFNNIGQTRFDYIQWGHDSTSLYAVLTWGNPTLYIFSVDSSGLTALNDYFGSYGPSGSKIYFDKTTGYLYDDDGGVTNPATGALVGNYNASGLLYNPVDGPASTFLVEDPSLNRAYMIGLTSGTTTYVIQSFDKTTFAPLNSITLPSLFGVPVRFVHWGTNGFAVLTPSETSGIYGAAATPGGMLYIISNTSL
jgi:hypothetical protein